MAHTHDHDAHNHAEHRHGDASGTLNSAFILGGALNLGFVAAENSFDDIIRIHIDEELGGKFVN